MRYVLSVLLGSVLLPAVQSQDNEAEKLFRDMEKKILAAKSFEITFEYQIEDMAGKKRTTKGTLLLTKDNQARLKISGYFGGKRDAPIELVSDGKQLKTKGAKFVVASNGVPGVEQGGQSEQATPKNFPVGRSFLEKDGVDVYGLFNRLGLREADGWKEPATEKQKQMRQWIEANAERYRIRRVWRKTPE